LFTAAAINAANCTIMSTPLSQLPEVLPDESVSQVFTNRESIDIDDDDIYGRSPFDHLMPSPRPRHNVLSDGTPPLSGLGYKSDAKYMIVTMENQGDTRIKLGVHS
jgi:hypothetical protein